MFVATALPSGNSRRIRRIFFGITRCESSELTTSVIGSAFSVAAGSNLMLVDSGTGSAANAETETRSERTVREMILDMTRGF